MNEPSSKLPRGLRWLTPYYERIGNPLNWRSVTRCQFFTVNSLLFFCSTGVLCHVLLGYPDLAPFTDPQGLELFRNFAIGAAGAWLMLGTASLWMRRHRTTSSPILVHATIQLSAICYAIAAYLAGPYTTPVLLIYLIFVCALVLFDWRAVAFGILTSSAILTFTLIAEQLYWLKSAPLFSSSPILEDGRVSWLWLLISGGISSFFILTTLIVITYVVARWRDREARYRDLSTTDHLTRVANRRTMMEHLERHFDRAVRNASPIACVMLDLDHFKHVNDTHGHLCGDRVLVEVAQILKSSIRSSDVVARYGGEEFVIILPDTDLAGAQSLAERFRARIETAEIPLDEGALKITASLGFAVHPTPNMNSHEDLLRLADNALYEAKNGGRNRVVGGPDTPIATVH